VNTRLNVADLNAIETRVGAWIAGCQSLLDVFTTYICVDHPNATLRVPGVCSECHHELEQMDPYLSFAVKMYHTPYFTLAKDYKSKDPVKKAAAKEMRQMAKPGVLAAVYRQGAGGMGKDKKTGDPKKLGLWGYAENMGIDMTLEQAQNITKVFRDSYPEIVSMWYALEIIIRSVLQNKPIKTEKPDILFAINRLHEIGIKFDKIVIDDKGNERVILRIQLPSSRYLHYVDAHIEDIRMSWSTEGHDVFRPNLIYSGVDLETKQWKSGITSHGGKVFENIVQAIARDVLCDKLLEIEKMGCPICGHVHDEGISETPNDPFYPGAREMVHLMSQPVSWALTLPLGADGFEDQIYHK
jgi:DNA polymerase bacteriophage-type